MRFFKVMILASLSLMGIACGKVQLDLDGLSTAAVPVVKLSEGAEFVAAAQSGQKTMNGYTIHSTTGSSFGKLEATTASGYKVYSTMQGRLISEEQEIKSSQPGAAH